MQAEDLLFILYTSGSTGKPKVLYTHAADTWCIQHTVLKTCSNMSEVISTGVLLMLVGLQAIVTLYMDHFEWGHYNDV